MPSAEVAGPRPVESPGEARVRRRVLSRRRKSAKGVNATAGKGSEDLMAADTRRMHQGHRESVERGGLSQGFRRLVLQTLDQPPPPDVSPASMRWASA